MEIYYTRYDGEHQEGLGSILQGQLHLYAFAKINGLEYSFPGFKNISHYQYTNYDSDSFDSELNNFFKFPSNNNKVGTNYLNPSWLIKIWGEQNNQDKKKYIQELFNNFNYNGQMFFDVNKTSVAIHIRNQNPKDVCFNEKRELFSEKKKKYFINLIELVKKKHSDDLDIHLFSQGNEDEFRIFVEKFNVKLHLNSNLIETFYHLVLSDILITSNSSLSWCAHLYGKNKFVYSRNNFFHSWYPNVFFIDFNGNLI